MRVWIYTRLSNDDDPERDSLQNQERICREFAVQRGDYIAGLSSDDNISGDYTVLYNCAWFDDTASSDDRILNCTLDQTAVGDNGRCYLAALKILCRAGVVGAGVDRPVWGEEF